MGERLLCKQEVIGSIPFTSTTVAPRVRPPGRRSGASLKGAGRDGVQAYRLRQAKQGFAESGGARRSPGSIRGSPESAAGPVTETGDGTARRP